MFGTSLLCEINPCNNEAALLRPPHRARERAREREIANLYCYFCKPLGALVIRPGVGVVCKFCSLIAAFQTGSSINIFVRNPSQTYCRE